MFPNHVFLYTIFPNVHENASHYEVVTSDWDGSVVIQLKGDDFEKTKDDTMVYGDMVVDVGPSQGICGSKGT